MVAVSQHNKPCDQPTPCYASLGARAGDFCIFGMHACLPNTTTASVHLLPFYKTQARSFTRALGRQTLSLLVTCRSPSWWTVAAPMIQSEPVLSPLMLRAVHILLTLLQLRLPAAWKSMQLSVVMLWNAAVQSGTFLALCNCTPGPYRSHMKHSMCQPIQATLTPKLQPLTCFGGLCRCC